LVSLCASFDAFERCSGVAIGRIVDALGFQSGHSRRMFPFLPGAARDAIQAPR
jgi:hypothetical protein